jgi:cellulose synthase/poly-beta-1,6-N-acetylglucosamine synthase-like glycosyltransferase
VLAILHTYLFYPLGLFIFSAKKKEVADVFSLKDELPHLTVIMAAYNEEQVLDAKIRSVVENNYPLNKIRFLIGSDASTDNTDAIIQKWSAQYPFIELVQFKARTGKVGIVNELVKRSGDDILVLTDANVLLKEGTLFNMVRFFKNKNVAQVCANIIKTGNKEQGISSQEMTYMDLENKIKLFESINWKVVMGVEGGCNAIRKENYAMVPANFCVDDFYVSMNVIEQGKEIVFDKEAICYEDASSLSSVEFARKVRISMGNFQNLSRYKKLLLPFWKGSAFAFLSHKVLRWITPFLMILSLTSALLLGFYNRVFFIIFIVQLLGVLSPLVKINNKLYKVVSHFYLMNLALLKGFFIFIKGVESSIWQPTKRNV